MKVYKSVRLDEELVNLIDAHEVGTDFTKKLTAILHSYFFDAEDRLSKIAEYDQMILKKEQDYQRKCENIRELVGDCQVFSKKVQSRIWSL